MAACGATVATTPTPRRAMYDAGALRRHRNELTAEFTLNTTTRARNPRPAALAGGQFVVLYGDASGNDGSYGVFSKVFNASGTQAVAEQVVNTTISGNQWAGCGAGRGAMAVWWSADNQIYGQRLMRAARRRAASSASARSTPRPTTTLRVTALTAAASWSPGTHQCAGRQHPRRWCSSSTRWAPRSTARRGSTDDGEHAVLPDIAALSGSTCGDWRATARRPTAPIPTASTARSWARRARSCARRRLSWWMWPPASPSPRTWSMPRRN